MTNQQTPDWTFNVRLIQARDITPGMALVVPPGNGHAPWIGPMIDKVSHAGNDIIAIHTVNGGGRAFDATTMVHVVDQLGATS